MYVLLIWCWELHVQLNESRHKPYTFYKNQLKMDHSTKYKMQNDKTTRNKGQRKTTCSLHMIMTLKYNIKGTIHK